MYRPPSNGEGVLSRRRPVPHRSSGSNHPTFGVLEWLEIVSCEAREITLRNEPSLTESTIARINNLPNQVWAEAQAQGLPVTLTTQLLNRFHANFETILSRIEIYDPEHDDESFETNINARLDVTLDEIQLIATGRSIVRSDTVPSSEFSELAPTTFFQDCDNFTVNGGCFGHDPAVRDGIGWVARILMVQCVLFA